MNNDLNITNINQKDKFILPVPKIIRINLKKIKWINFVDFYKIIDRDPDHIFKYILEELCTTGSIDSNNFMILHCKILSNSIESILRKYIIKYVQCNTCKSLITSITRNKKMRIDIINCKNCFASQSTCDKIFL